jgi:signal transduction histidine kinase
METIELIANGDSSLRVTGKGASELAAFAGYFNTIMEKSNVRDESRQEFVSNVSHELKTPITSIKVLADSLNMQPDAPVELYREFMQDITKEIDRESKIIEDLLSIVRMDKSAGSLNIASVNINELIEMVLKRLTPLAEKKNVEILFESFRPVVAEVDEVKMTQVVSNLVENAIKYNINDGWVHVSLNADYQYLFIRVEDSGIGIPQQSQDMVFDRFYRVDKARSRETGGTGLGLAIVQQIVVLHHGTIKLYSEEGNGTTFTVRIPLNYVG